MYYFLIACLLILIALTFRSIHRAPPSSRARSAERFFPPHLKHRVQPTPAEPSHSRSYWKQILLGLLVVLLGYTIFSMVSEHQARLHAESARRSQEAAWAIEATELVERIRNDTDLVEELVRECLRVIENRSSSVFNLTTDRRDVDRVRRLLDGLNPYDTESKLQYVTMEQMRQREFMSYLAERSYARHQRTGEAVIEFAVTYLSDGFSGLREAWSILECPLRNGEPNEPRLDILFLE